MLLIQPITKLQLHGKNHIFSFNLRYNFKMNIISPISICILLITMKIKIDSQTTNKTDKVLQILNILKSIENIKFGKFWTEAVNIFKSL